MELSWSMTPDGDTSDLSPLLASAARGDARAWRDLVDRYGRRVYALAKSRCRDSDLSEEITQSVFATIAAKIGGGEYQEQGKFESWLFRVAMNRVRDHVRRVKRRPEGVDAGESELVAGASPDPALDEGLLVRLRAAMMELSDADREIVELRHHGGMSFKHMAELLHEPMGTLLARHHRALRKLKETMVAMDEGRQQSGTPGRRPGLPGKSGGA